MRGDIAGLRSEMQTGMQNLRSEMQTGTQSLRGEIQQTRSQFHDDFRWLLRVMLGGFIAVLGLLGHIAHWF